jgi:hypothetical protein
MMLAQVAEGDRRETREISVSVAADSSRQRPVIRPRMVAAFRPRT